MNASDMGPQGTSQATEPRDSTSSDDSRGLTVKDDGAAGIPAEGTASHPAVGSDDQSKSSPKFLREVLANLPPRVWPILGSSSSSTLDNNLLKINLPAVDTHVAWTHKQSHTSQSELGFTLEEYRGMPIQLRPAGSPIAPESQVTFSWNVMGKEHPVYTDTFLVVDDSAGHDEDFDILFGEQPIPPANVPQTRFFN
ncbi:hypothetical protein XANCAGTX0491_000891 [Xanthoria calcicola]